MTVEVNDQVSGRVALSPDAGVAGPTSGRAVSTVVSAGGVVAAAAGIEHGVGELMQSSARAGSLVIESWPDVAAFDSLSGEPALTVIPDLRVAGMVTIVSSLLLGWWALRARARPSDAWLLLGLSVLLLLVGGGFGPPLVGLLLGVGLLRAARPWPPDRSPGPVGRSLQRAWRPLLVLTVAGFLALFPGVVVLSWWTGFDSPWLPALLPPAAFAGLVLTLLGALAHDRSAQRQGRAVVLPTSPSDRAVG